MNKVKNTIVGSGMLVIFFQDGTSRNFKSGDTAIYDWIGYDLLGQIKKITDKSVIIEKKYSTKTSRMTIERFVSMNYNLDVERSIEARHEHMMNS